MAPSTVTFISLLLLVVTLAAVSAETKKYAFATIKSCSGCSLNRLPDVKQFIFQDVPQYNNVEFKHIQGANPELVLYDENEEEMERLNLSSLTRQECNDLLVSKGFTRSTPQKDEI
ncbi:selenoprotein M-like [Polistes fuscatus]|uniref:selenoprotein M-like n=1 Tax=Polistes fuscatus TaxID=30207 RepID=UPI001CA8C731|nr:selenoprotein M-like [Polistes fuscatus]